MASSRVRPPIATSLQMDATVRESRRSYAPLGGDSQVFRGGGRRLVQDRGALGELEVEGRRRKGGVGLEEGDLGDASYLVTDRFDEPRHEAVQSVDRDLDVIVGTIDGRLDRARVVAFEDDRLAGGDAIRSRDPAVTGRQHVLGIAGR